MSINQYSSQPTSQRRLNLPARTTHASDALLFTLALFMGSLLMSAPARAIDLGTCERERAKVVYVLQHTFQPYLDYQVPLNAMRGQLLDLAISFNGWVEDIDECYRAVFRRYHAPIDNPMINSGLDFSTRLYIFNQYLQEAQPSLRYAEFETAKWRDLEEHFRPLLIPMLSADRLFHARLNNRVSWD